MPCCRQSAMNLALTCRHMSIRMFLFFVVSPVMPSTFQKLVSESGIGTRCAISLCERRQGVANHDLRRSYRATMDAARAPLGTMGGATQIELEKVTWSEWKPQMRRGRERRDFRGSGGRACARVDDEGWRGVHRHWRLYETRFGDAGKAPPALGSQITWVFVSALF